MAASWPHCSARRSMVAILALARALASPTIRRSSPSRSCRPAGASEAPARSNDGGSWAFIPATSRSVGIRSRHPLSPLGSPAGGSAPHGARHCSSSRAPWHCRARASAHHRAGFSGPDAKPSTTSAAKAASRPRDSRAAVRLVGGESHAEATPSWRRAICGDTSLPAAAARTRNASRSPSNTRASRIFRSGSASRPGRKVSRWPARFPLSTVDT